jgi:putative effector of murein hydrolase
MAHELQPAAWAIATLGSYLAAKALYHRHARWYTSPLLLTWAFCFLIALGLHVHYQDYLQGTRWLLTLLGPATMSFTLPIYEQRRLIRKNWRPLLIGAVVGSALGLTSSFLLAWSLNLSADMRLSMLPRSITTPFALDFVKAVGGKPELAATCVVITGLFGASMGELLLHWLPLRSAFARGAMFGMGAHSVGTAKAREIGLLAIPSGWGVGVGVGRR